MKILNNCRMVMNVPSNAVTTNKNNSENGEGAGDAAAAAEGQDEVQPSTSTSNGNNVMQASNYDATKARKSKKRAETEVWQEKILRCLEPVDVPQAETPKKDYIDQALVTLGMQMRENVSNHEILDLIEDIQVTVNWACREKHRRIEMANQVSNNSQMYQGVGPGPQGPMAVPVTYEEQHQQHQQLQPFFNTF